VVSSHGVVLTTALAAVVCALAAVVRCDALAIRRAWGRRARAVRPVLDRLDGGLRSDRGLCGPTPPPIERVTAELQRLHRQRTAVPAYGSEKWLIAVVQAYDEWLQVACGHMSITHHLPALDGIDRDIERLRVEGELIAAGLKLHTRPVG